MYDVHHVIDAYSCREHQRHIKRLNYKLEVFKELHIDTEQEFQRLYEYFTEQVHVVVAVALIYIPFISACFVIKTFNL